MHMHITTNIPEHAYYHASTHAFGRGVETTGEGRTPVGYLRCDWPSHAEAAADVASLSLHGHATRLMRAGEQAPQPGCMPTKSLGALCTHKQ